VSGIQLLATPGAAFVLDVLVKSVVLLLAAGLATLCLRRAAAATRHLVWLCALVALLLLPLLARVVPGIPVAGWAWMVPATPTKAPAPPSAAPTVEVPQLPDPSPVAPPPPLGLQRPLSTAVAPPIGILLGVYGTGIVLALWQVVLGMACVRRFERDSIAPEENSPLRVPCEETAAAMGVRAPVRLRLSDTAPVPMTWGWRRPTVLLPTAATKWEPERVRVALLHEMAHIARGDWVAQMFAHVVCALYWFHPLVWLAAARLRAESERAADDRVLLAGVPAADYARHLLEIAQSLRVTVTSGATAMAATPHIEPRLRALLGADKRRNAPRVLPTLTAFSMVAIVLAGVQADDRRPSQVKGPQAPFIIRMWFDVSHITAEGMTVDILAVGTEDKKRWWKPDGKPIAPEKLKADLGPAHDLFTRSEGIALSTDPDHEYRHLMFRYRQRPTINAGANFPKATRGNGGVITWYSFASMRVPKAAKFQNVSLHIPNGPWKEQTVWRIGDPSRRDYPKFVRGRLSRVFPEPVVFFGPQPARETIQKVFKVKTEVWIQDRLGEEEMRVNFRDRAGRELRMTKWSFDALRGRTRDRVTAFMGETVEPQEIASISFESRPYRIFNLPAFPTMPSSLSNLHSGNLPAAPVSR
jgi:beta-lactamase regulating signal transducer with metallopeptidase domain